MLTIYKMQIYIHQKEVLFTTLSRLTENLNDILMTGLAIWHIYLSASAYSFILSGTF